MRAMGARPIANSARLQNPAVAGIRVEAKHRQPIDGSDAASNKFRLGRLLHKALKKRANNDRVVFIDINVPDAASENEVPSYLSKALSDLRKFEGRLWPNGEPLPPAYLFVTNFPYQYNLEKSSFRRSVIAEGFQIPDFKGDAAFSSLRGALDSRGTNIPTCFGWLLHC